MEICCCGWATPCPACAANIFPLRFKPFRCRALVVFLPLVSLLFWAIFAALLFQVLGVLIGILRVLPRLHDVRHAGVAEEGHRAEETVVWWSRQKRAFIAQILCSTPEYL